MTEIKRGRPMMISTSGTEQIAISKIRRDGGTQPRAGLDEAHVQRLVEALDEGLELPAVTLFFDGETYWLADGFHRFEAHQRKLIATITADIRQGARRDAVLHSVGANRAHGLPRSRDDVRRAIETLLRDEEWGKWSDREIARQVGCSPTTVGNVRSTVQIGQSATRISGDGRERPATQPARSEPAAPRCFDCGTTEYVEAIGGAVKHLCRRCHTKRTFVTYGLSHDALIRGYAYRLTGMDIEIQKVGMFIQRIKAEPHEEPWGGPTHVQRALDWIEARVKAELPAPGRQLLKADEAEDTAITATVVIAAAPAPVLPDPAFDLNYWSKRASAIGANILGYGQDWAIVDARGVKYRFANGKEDQLIEQIKRMEALAKLQAPIPSPLPEMPPPAPEPDMAQYVIDIEHISSTLAGVIERLQPNELKAMYLIFIANDEIPGPECDLSEELWSAFQHLVADAGIDAVHWAAAG